MSCTQSKPRRKYKDVLADRPDSNTKAAAHHVSVSHQTVCRVLKGHHSHIFHFQRVQTFFPAHYLFQLPLGATAMSAAAGLHSSFAEQL
ncbi:hypothetical protein TNCV_3120451 [Trichonephila clavipes]|uniref:Uncharacterized protein n=1 Tax=Trichonephila clavipes TaxID=2585209 RepID=A0A8X7BGX3_TRICX|nr:hypothetical protein TNCV_3120451 [Trichonephila clavipes]